MLAGFLESHAMRHICSFPEVSLHGLHVEFGDGDALRMFNPSVAVLENRLITTFRASNIERDDRTSRFYLLPPGGVMKNEIVIGELNDDLALVRETHVVPPDQTNGTSVAPGGMEDVRIVASPDGRLEAMGCLPQNFRYKPRGRVGFGSEFYTQMARIQFGPEFQITKLTTYESPFKRRMEKNWSPFYVDGKFCVVYQWNPLIILELLPDGTTRFLKWLEASNQLKGLRGASQGIPTANGYLFVVHRKFIVAGKVRFAHQIIELGRDLQPTRLSETFGFVSNKLIEYCAGIALFKNRCVLSFGLNDSLPFLAAMDAVFLEQMLTQKLALISEDQGAMAAPDQAAALVAAAEFPEIIPPTFAQRLKIKGREFAVRVVERFLPI